MSEKPTFEEALKTLEDAVSRLENGQLPLDEALACFEAGIEGAGHCRKLLQDVEDRIERLLKRADGTLVVEEFPVKGEDEA